MKKAFFLLFVLFTLSNLFSQTNEGFCINEPDWGKIDLVSKPIPDSLPSLLIITNRPFTPDNENRIYFPNAIAEYRKVTYLEVTCTGDRWLIRPIESFQESMKYIDDGNDLLLFVHGHGKDFPSSITRAMRIKKRYNVALILFERDPAK